jgi:hypothetical protein
MRRKAASLPMPCGTESHSSGGAATPPRHQDQHQAPSGSTTAATTAALPGAGALPGSPSWFDGTGQSDEEPDLELDLQLLDFLQGELASSTAQPGLWPQQQQQQPQQQELQGGYGAVPMALASDQEFSEYLEAVMQDELQMTLREQHGLPQANCSSSSACATPQQQPFASYVAPGLLSSALQGCSGGAPAGVAHMMPSAASAPAGLAVAPANYGFNADNSSSSSATLSMDLYMAQQPSAQPHTPLGAAAAAAAGPGAQGRSLRRQQLLKQVQDLLQEEQLLSAAATGRAAAADTAGLGAATPCRTASMPAQAPAAPARMESGRWLQAPSASTTSLLLREQSGSCQLSAHGAGLSPSQARSSNGSPISGVCPPPPAQQQQPQQGQHHQQQQHSGALPAQQQPRPQNEAAIVARMAQLHTQVLQVSEQLDQLQALLAVRQSRPGALATAPLPFTALSKCMGL